MNNKKQKIRFHSVSWICIVLLWVVINSAQALAQEQKVDLSGLPIFWEMVDQLENGNNPTEEDWNNLCSHPAYAQIQKSGNRCAHLRKLMPLVFMPSNTAELEKTLNSGSELAQRICRHLLMVKENRATLEQYAQSDIFENWIAVAHELLQTYVPPGSTSKADFPQIYIILFEDNGFGSPNIVLDLQRLYSSPEACNISLIGHEAHHVYLHRLSNVQFPSNEHYYPVVNALSGLHTEGMASMIDKQDWLDEENTGCDLAYQDEFRAAYWASPQIFREFDNLFSEVHNGTLDLNSLDNIKSKLLWGGHANGMYMAKVIEEQMGGTFLASLIYNPIDFIEGYNESAKLSGDNYVFSEEAMAFLKTVEKELLIK